MVAAEDINNQKENKQQIKVQEYKIKVLENLKKTIITLIFWMFIFTVFRFIFLD